MKIVITGTHFTPAQAVIEEFRNNPDVEIIYLGRNHTQEGDRTPSIESRVVPSLGVKFIPIISGRLQRSFTIYTIPSLLKIPIGLFQSFYYLVKYQPDVVLAFGGYLSVPVVFSAWLLSIPIIIHEQTLVEGLSNKICSWFADKIAVSFNQKSGANSKVILTGNPIRQELFAKVNLTNVLKDYRQLVGIAHQQKLPVILITGGNQGSHIINQTVAEILPELTKIACVVHQTGDSKYQDYEMLDSLKESLKYPERYMAIKWIDVEAMVYLLHSVNLVVSRAGINTLQELAYFQIPTLVIPVPYVQKDEQTVNARFFEHLGLAQVLLQSRLNSQTMLAAISSILKKLPQLKETAKPAKDIVIPDAAKRLVLETILLVKQ